MLEEDNNRELFTLERLKTVQDIINHWSLFTEAQTRLEAKKATMGVTLEELFKQLSYFTQQPEDVAVIFLVKRDKTPVGIFVLTDDTRRFSPQKLLWIYLMFSKDKQLGVNEFYSIAMEYAKYYKYDIIKAQTARLNGAIRRVFQNKTNSNLAGVIWEKEVK